MNKLKEIVNAWAISRNPTDEQKEVANKRYSTCNTCPYKIKDLGVERCGLCGCILSAKIFTTETNACPDDRWES